MKILFLIQSLNRGGAERQLVLLAKGLEQQRHCVSVGFFYPGGSLENELQDTGVRVTTLNKRGRWDVFGFLLRLVRFVKQKNPDIVHGYLGIPNILTVLLKLLFPHIHVVWGIRASNMDLSRYDWFWRLSFFLERKLSRFADLIIVNSYAGMEYSAQNGFPMEKMIVIPNGIETANFSPQPTLREKTRKEWGISNNETLIGLAARLDPKKDHITFLKAAAQVSRVRPDVRFVCVGRGDEIYYERLRHVSDECGLSGRILWAGSRDDMPAVYNGLDILCLSSAFGEGFPNVIGEAMACGVPCVVTDVGDSARIVGDNGIVVPPGQPETLASGLLEMVVRIEKSKEVLANRLRRIIVEEFSVEKMIRLTEAALSDLLE
jgi:glycosyltransferase involved in cell wall biosynthesis